jgi:hypothetical protein
VYIVIDGMRTDSFEQAASSGKAPALAFLRDRGSYVRDAVAAFPSITPCATATLITGETPDRHGIPGQCWYDFEDKRFVNYGQGPRLAVVQKVNEMVTDLFVNLNHKHLRKDALTLHESLHDLGYATASTNFLVHRGRVPNEVHPDAMEKLLIKGHLPDQILGPKEHYFADVVDGPTAACQEHLGIRGKLKRIKATDEWASCVTRELLERDAADMILFYLHENDHLSHHKGPKVQVENLIRASELIGNILEASGSWERTADEVGFVLTADHGQTPVIKDDEHLVDIDDVLEGFDVLRPHRGPDSFEDHDVAHAGNGRTGLVYLNPDKADRVRDPVLKALAAWDGIDQVMWRQDGWAVVDSHRGTTRFRPAESGGVRDERGNRWEIEGDLGAVGGVAEGGEIRTTEYPLALWRIDRALRLDRCGDIITTAKLTHEIGNLVDTEHRGEHGSLHAQDSLVVFLSTIGDPPIHAATTDVAPHILRHFESLNR